MCIMTVLFDGLLNYIKINRLIKKMKNLLIASFANKKLFWFLIVDISVVRNRQFH